MKYHHLGIPTQTSRVGETYLAEYKVYVTDHEDNPYGIQWMRYEPDCPLPELVKTVPHVAFEVEDLESAIKGKEVLMKPNSPSEGVRVAIVVEKGAPVEFLEFTRFQYDWNDKIPLPEGIQADVPYGPHERNVLDFWKAESADPTPLVISIHGGGFDSGDKSDLFEPHGLRYIVESLANGVSFASINYRLAPDTPLIDIFLDVARAVQFLRYKADEWNIDSKRLAVCGGSAGGGASLWLAFHDDVADLTSEDPVLRESSRVTAAVAFDTQSTYDFEQWEEILGSPPTTIFDVDGDLDWYHLTREEVHSPKGRAVRKELDLLGMINPGDPPVYLCNSHPDIDLEDGGIWTTIQDMRLLSRKDATRLV